MFKILHMPTARYVRRYHILGNIEMEFNTEDEAEECLNKKTVYLRRYYLDGRLEIYPIYFNSKHINMDLEPQDLNILEFLIEEVMDG